MINFKLLNIKSFLRRSIPFFIQRFPRFSSRLYENNDLPNTEIKDELSRIYKKLEKETNDPELLEKLKREIEENVEKLEEKGFNEEKTVQKEAKEPKMEGKMAIDKSKVKKSGRRKSKNSKKANMGGNLDEKSQVKKEFSLAEAIPPNLVIKSLFWPPTDSGILLLGVEKRNPLHASFIQDIMTEYNIDLINVQIPPDMPYFIRSETNLNTAWSKFAQGKFDYKFLVNPKPNYLADIIMDDNKLRFFIEGPIMNTEDIFEIGSTFIYTKRRGPINQLKHNASDVDCFLNPLLYSYNNPEKRINLVINDIPMLLQRDYVARAATLKELKDLFDTYLDYLENYDEKKPKDFDPGLLKPEYFIKPKIDYITEVLRQSCLISKRVLAIVDLNYADMIEEAWNNLEPDLRSLNDCIMKVKTKEEVTYLDYIEKHVILDLIFEPLIEENFIKYKTFPFSGEGTFGADVNKTNTLLIWDHQYRKYAKRINNCVGIKPDYVISDHREDILRGDPKLGALDDDENNEKQDFNVEIIDKDEKKIPIITQEFLNPKKRKGNIKI